MTSPIKHVAKMQLLSGTVMTAQRSNINFVSRPGLSRDVLRRTLKKLYRLMLHAMESGSASVSASRNNRCTDMQVPFPEAQGACSLLNGHSMSQACRASSVVS